MNCLIVDDDPLTCDTVESFLTRIGGVDYCLKVDDGVTALHLLAAKSFDVVFLDLNLPGMDGVSLLKAMPRQTPVIIISASSDFGAESYQFDVVDYLVKPLEFDRFAQTIVKLRSRRTGAGDSRAEKEEETLFLRDSAAIQQIELSRLLYIEAQSNYATFVRDDGESVMSLVSLRKLEKILPQQFVRIHRSYIVNRRKIRHIEGNRVTLESKSPGSLPIGRSYREELLETLKIIN